MPEKLGVDHWRTRAKEARDLAEKMDDANARRRMLKIANDYEKIADRAQVRMNQRKAPPQISN